MKANRWLDQPAMHVTYGVLPTKAFPAWSHPPQWMEEAMSQCPQLHRLWSTLRVTWKLGTPGSAPTALAQPILLVSCSSFLGSNCSILSPSPQTQAQSAS